MRARGSEEGSVKNSGYAFNIFNIAAQRKQKSRLELRRMRALLRDG
jgi:hypothetical protein